MTDITPDHFDELLLESRPLLDLRAPVEFARGSIPGAENHPLLDDDEREQVGTTHRREGAEAAEVLGHRLVSGAAREARLAAWCRWSHAHPDGALYCFRGGRRSHVVQSWLSESGHAVPLVVGGYKALRHHLLARLETCGTDADLLVIGGRTGTGKTELLERLPRALDLEGLANHRGSAFGRRVDGQPAPIDFEHRIAVTLMRLLRTPAPIAIEDESRNVGRLSVPPALLRNMNAAPIVLVEMPVADRVSVTLDAYVVDACAEYQRAHGDEAGFRTWSESLRASFDRIRKRLGGQRHAEISQLLESALDRHARLGDTDAHRAWIERLLVEYYDPMYDYQLESKMDRVVHRGSREEVDAWIRARTGTTAS